MKRPTTWLLAVIGLLLLLYLLGCALKLSTTNSLDVFSRDHTRHETNALPQKP